MLLVIFDIIVGVPSDGGFSKFSGIIHRNDVWDYPWWMYICFLHLHDILPETKRSGLLYLLWLGLNSDIILSIKSIFKSSIRIFLPVCLFKQKVNSKYINKNDNISCLFYWNGIFRNFLIHLIQTSHSVILVRYYWRFVIFLINYYQNEK